MLDLINRDQHQGALLDEFEHLIMGIRNAFGDLGGGGTTGLGSIAYTNIANIFTQNQLINKLRPELQLLMTGGSLAKARIIQPTTDTAVFTNNLSYDGANWNLDDTALPGLRISLSTAGAGGSINFSTATAGANPRTLSLWLSIDGATGTVTPTVALAKAALISEVAYKDDPNIFLPTQTIGNGTSANTGILLLDGRSAASDGPRVIFNRGGSLRGNIGAGLQGGDLNDIVVASTALAVRLNAAFYDLLIADGPTQVVSLPHGKLKFPATQLASTEPNTLDDYEEGTWTPVIGGSVSTTGQSYASQIGTYTKVGNRVHITWDVGLSNKGTITGTVIIANLPFFGAQNPGVATRRGNMATNWMFVGMVLLNNTLLVRGNTGVATNTETDLVTADIANSTYFSGEMTYSI